MDDLLIPFLCLAAVVITLLINHYNSQQNKKLPPQADGGWPLIGHLRLLSGPDPPHITLSAMADRFGPVFTLRLGVRRALIVSTWESAKEVFATNNIVFSNRPNTAATRHMSYNFAIFGLCPYGPYWRKLRKITTVSLLSPNKVASLGHMFETEVEGLARKLHARGEAPSEMKKALGDTTLNLMVRIISGDTCAENMDVGKTEKIREAIFEFLRMMETLTIPDVLPFLKWLDVFGGANESFKRTGKKMDSVLQVWLDDLKRARASGGSEWSDGGFMGDMIVEAENLSDEFPEHNADTINKATCQNMILGGADTMTVTIVWALSLLLNNPHTIRIAQHELDTHVSRDKQVKVSDLKNLVYTQAIIKETLRLYPPTLLMPPRQSSEDCTVAGYHIPAGTYLIVNLWKLHRDHRVWDQPLDFQPERFVTGLHKETDVTGKQFEMLPFGSGRRICPGVSFAMQLMMLLLATLLHGFDIESASEEVVDMTGSLGVTNIKATPLEVVFRPRLSSDIYD